MSSMASLGRSQSSIGYEKPGPNSASGTRRSEAGPFILIKPGEKIFLAIVYPLYKTFEPYAVWAYAESAFLLLFHYSFLLRPRSKALRHAYFLNTVE